MIVCCPSCVARFRLDPKKHGDKRITLKCSRCRHPITATVPRNFSVGSPQVLIGHGDRSAGTRILQILSSEGIGSQLCGNGDEVLRCLKGVHPAVIVLHVALPEAFTFQVLDALRSDAGLADIKVLLISSVYNASAYKRPPSSLYGADDHLDESRLAEDLVMKIRDLARDPGKKSADEERSAPADSANPRPAVRRGEDEKGEGRTLADTAEKARNIAGKIVLGIARSDRKKVREAIRGGNFFRIFDEEIREGSRLFERQVSDEIRMQEDFLHQAFLSFLARCRRELQQKNR